ncbi:MAG: hypothetical protein Tsb0010_15210 [Parvularculaceae bacterium]
MMRLLTSIAAALVMIFAHSAAAADLSAGQIERFVASLDDLREFGARLEAEGKQADAFEDLAPAPGEPFRPYTRGTEYLREIGEYGAFEQIVRRHGFSDGAAWAETGDRVMVAFMANLMERENPQAAQMAASMSPEMLDQMPPAMRERMAGVMAMVTTMLNAPPEDRAAVAPFMDRIEAWMESQGGGRPSFGPN